MPVLIASWPEPLTVEAVVVPVMPSIALRTVPTEAVLPAPTPIVTLPLASVVTEVWPVEKVMDLPSTIKDDPFAGVAASVSEFVAATSKVAAVMSTGVERWFWTVVPVTVLLVGGPNNRAESGAEPAGLGPYSYTDARSSYSSSELAIDYNAALVFVAGAFSE